MFLFHHNVITSMALLTASL